MEQQGWIKLHRNILDNWLWQEKPFSKGQAWIDLLLIANHEEKKRAFKGEVITCNRGDVNLSISSLSDRWGWSRKKTRNFLNTLENDKMVTVKATTNRTTITIEKYSVFQNLGTTSDTTSDTTREQRGNSEGSITKNDKNEKNNILLTDFDVFWKAYPKKAGKAAAQKAFEKAMLKTNVQTLLSAIEQQKQSEQWLKDNGQFIPYPATWLNQGRWEDELTPLVPPPATPPKPKKFRQVVIDGEVYEEEVND